jgi:hypothetical protein
MRPSGNPRGMGKVAERSTRGWLLDRTWSPPGVGAVDGRATNMSKPNDDALRGARWALVPNIWRVVEPRDVDVNAHGRLPAGGGAMGRGLSKGSGA